MNGNRLKSIMGRVRAKLSVRCVGWRWLAAVRLSRSAAARACALAIFILAGPALAQEFGIAARVNGVDITVFRLERHFEDYLKLQRRDPGMMTNPRVYNRLKREALDQLIDTELLWQQAQSLGIEVADEDVRARRAEIEAGFRTREAFERRIAHAGFDDASYDDYLRRDIAASRALEVLIGEIEVSDDEVRSLYEANKHRFERPEQVRARHILLRLPSDSTDAVEVEQRIQALLAEIRAGADFAEMAQRHSQDTNAGEGGDLGYFERGRMVPPFEEAAFALSPGEIGGPVRTEFGWHLIKVEDRRPAGSMPEAEALQIVRAHLLQTRWAEVRSETLVRLREGAEIELGLRL